MPKYEIPKKKKKKKKKKKLLTNTNPNKSKAQLDYIIINKKWINSTLNCKAYSFIEEVSSNNRIISANIFHTEIRNKELKLHDMTGPQLQIVM